VIALLIAKIILDGGATVAFAINRNAAMAFMFFGFTIADGGALWIIL